MICAKTAEPVDLPFVLWIRVGRKKHKFNRICQVAPMCPHAMAHWRCIANATEPSVCGGNAALCQNALTTCYTAHCRVSLSMPGSPGTSFLLQIAPSHWWSGPHVMHGSFGPPKPTALWCNCADMVYHYITLPCMHSYTIMLYLVS